MGERIVDAGDRLEHFIDSFEEEGAVVQLQLLTATVKLFLKKPDKAKGLVQNVLNLATESSDNPDLRDRGYVYWRLLSTDPTAARKVVLAERPVISAETFSLPPDYLSVLLENLSSLSSVYHRPPDEFVRGQRSVVFMPYEEREDSDTNSDKSSSDSDDDDDDNSKSDDDDSNDDDDGDDNDSDKDESSNNSDDSDDSSDRRSKKRNKKKGSSSPKKAAAPAPDDLLGDILNMGISSTSTSQQPMAMGQQTSGGGGGGDFDLFGFGDDAPSTNNGGGYNGPPLTMAFDSNKGQGLEMSLAFKQEDGSPMMVVQAVNRSNNAISRIDIKFNKNYLGIQPTSTVPLNGQINPGQTQTVSLPLQLSQPPTPKNPLDLTVQMAARSIRANTAKPPVTMFAVQIPAEIFFDSNHPNTLSDRGAFLTEWRAITEDQSQTIKQCKNTDTETVKNIFTANNCGFVADRQIPNRGVSLYFASTIKSVAVLLEISLANNGACRVVVKSRDKYLSFVACQTALKLVNS